MNLFKVIFVIVFLTSCSAPMPNGLGIKSEKEKVTLAACPEKPNCVISFKSDDNDEHFLAPIEIVSNKERAYKKIIGILQKNSSVTILTKNENYIHAQYTSSIFKFVDDVEFFFGIEGLVHFRSASRTGHSDLGVNRKRIEEIRFKFQQNDF